MRSCATLAALRRLSRRRASWSIASLASRARSSSATSSATLTGSAGVFSATLIELADERASRASRLGVAPLRERFRISPPRFRQVDAAQPRERLGLLGRLLAQERERIETERSDQRVEQALRRAVARAVGRFDRYARRRALLPAGLGLAFFPLDLAHPEVARHDELAQIEPDGRGLLALAHRLHLDRALAREGEQETVQERRLPRAVASGNLHKARALGPHLDGLQPFQVFRLQANDLQRLRFLSIGGHDSSISQIWRTRRATAWRPRRRFWPPLRGSSGDPSNVAFRCAESWRETDWRNS